MMKKGFIITCLFLHSFLQAQVTIKTAVDTSLFLGFPNTVTIESSTIPVKDLTLVASFGQVKGGNGQYSVFCSEIRPQTVLEVYHGKKLVASRRIKISSADDPMPFITGDQLYGNKNNTIGKSAVARLRYLIMKTSVPLPPYRIVSFTYSLWRNNKPVVSGQVNGAALSSGDLNNLQQVQAGDKLIFEGIRAQYESDDHGRYLPTLELKVI